ncbi:MAG: PKD domain-containing protein [Sphingomonadales bacterium]
MVWDFGDGMTETAFKTRHVYSKPGSYEIKIKIQDACGERLLKRKVSI